MDTAAAGALVGKFGGSAASKGDPFAIGSECTIAMPDKKIARLFVGINGAVADPQTTLDSIRLEVWGVEDT